MTSETRSSTIPTSRSSRSPVRRPVGWGIRQRAPRKRVGLELGNNAPVIIEPSGDWKTAASKIKVAGFSHAGQSCISTQRVYVQRSIHDDFVAGLVDQVGALVVGDPLDDSTDVSALISPDDTERVSAWIDEAVGRWRDASRWAATVHGRLLEPTVLTGVVPDMKVCTEEVFGPVVGGCGLRRARRGARARERHPVRIAGGDLHERARHRVARGSDARLRRRARRTRYRRGGPTRCRTAACATAATLARGRRTPCAR